MSSENPFFLLYERDGFKCSISLSEDQSLFRCLSAPELCKLLMAHKRIPCETFVLDVSTDIWSTREERSIRQQVHQLATAIQKTALDSVKKLVVRFRCNLPINYEEVTDFWGRSIPELHQTTPLEDEMLSFLVDAVTRNHTVTTVELLNFPGNLPRALLTLKTNLEGLLKFSFLTQAPTHELEHHGTWIYNNPLGYTRNDLAAINAIISKNLCTLEFLACTNYIMLDVSSDEAYGVWLNFRDTVASAPHLKDVLVHRYLWIVNYAPDDPSAPALTFLRRRRISATAMLPMQFGAKLTRARLRHCPKSESIFKLTDKCWFRVMREFARVEPSGLFVMLRQRPGALALIADKFDPQERFQRNDRRRPFAFTLGNREEENAMIYLPATRNGELYDGHCSYGFRGTGVVIGMGNGRPVTIQRITYHEGPLLNLRNMLCFQQMKIRPTFAYSTNSFLATVSDRLYTVFRDTVLSLSSPNLVELEISLAPSSERSTIEDERWALILEGLLGTLERLIVCNIDRNIPKILKAIRKLPVDPRGSEPTGLKSLKLSGPAPRDVELSNSGATLAFIRSLQKTLSVIKRQLVEFDLDDVPIGDSRIRGLFEDPPTGSRPTFYKTVAAFDVFKPIVDELRGLPNLEEVTVTVMVRNSTRPGWSVVGPAPETLQTGRLLKRAKALYFPNGDIKRASVKQWLLAMRAVNSDKNALNWLLRYGTEQWSKLSQVKRPLEPPQHHRNDPSVEFAHKLVVAGNNDVPFVPVVAEDTAPDDDSNVFYDAMESLEELAPTEADSAAGP